MRVNSIAWYHYLPMMVFVHVCFIIYYSVLSVAGSDLLKTWNLLRCVVGKEAIHILLTHLH